MSAAEPICYVYAKDGSPLSIARAFEQQTKSIRGWGPGGPIGNLPIVFIPGGPIAPTVSRPRTATPSVVASRAREWTAPYLATVGRAASFYTHDRDGEAFALGAFTDAIAEGQTYATIDHDKSLNLASIKDGTLRLDQNATGLFFALDHNTPMAERHRVFERAWKREFSGASICYVEKSGYDLPSGRVITKAGIIEISLTTSRKVPVDKTTWVAVDKPGRMSYRSCEPCRARGTWGLVTIDTGRCHRGHAAERR